MRICLVEERFLNSQWTGPSNHVRQLAIELSRQGNEVAIICEDEGCAASKVQPERAIDENGIEVKPLKTWGIGHSRILSGLGRIIRDADFDIIHSQGYRNLSTDLSAIAAKLNDIPFVLSPRGSLRGYSYREVNSMTPIAVHLYDGVTRGTILRSADAVVVTSTGEWKDALSMGVFSDRLHLIPHGIDLSNLESSKINLLGEPKLLTVGRITPRRNTIDIVRSMLPITKELPEAILYVVGDPIRDSYDKADSEYPRLLKGLLQDPMLQRKVRILGGLYGGELWKLYSSCDIFVYASSYDNFGFALLEAAHFGLPTVSTDVGIARQLIGENQGGRLINDHTPDSIASAVLSIARESSHEKMKAHLISKSSQFTIARNCEEHLKLYEQLVRHS